jgi:hypothetical protein
MLALITCCAIGVEVLGDGFNRSLGFGSVMEVQHASAIRWIGQAVGCNHTAVGMRMG